MMLRLPMRPSEPAQMAVARAMDPASTSTR
jgi:hypothetical protein